VKRNIALEARLQLHQQAAAPTAPSHSHRFSTHAGVLEQLQPKQHSSRFAVQSLSYKLQAAAVPKVCQSDLESGLSAKRCEARGVQLPAGVVQQGHVQCPVSLQQLVTSPTHETCSVLF
jgi:hypothetical protein